LLSTSYPADLTLAHKLENDVSAKANLLINSLLVLVFLLTISPLILNAQDNISDSEINQMRKAAQENLANKQGLKYEIVDVQMKDGQFILKYDLNESSDAEYVVKTVFLREKDPLFKIIPLSTSGAIGRGKFAGKDNTIVWDYKNDYAADLNGDDFYFVLDIKRIEHSSTPWLWIGLGSAAAAGTAVYFILGNKTTPAAVEIPPLIITRPN
jgi:hypothetical protein